MTGLKQVNQQLWLDAVPLCDIAQQYSTPCYAYSQSIIEKNFGNYQNALNNQPHLICFAVKANSNIAILQTLARLGAGFDIVSVGELERVLIAGGKAEKVVFSGVGKTADEMRRALEVGIHCFNVESEAELCLLDQTAGDMGLIAPVSMRVNPDVDAGTHPYIATGLKESKFGITIDCAEDTYARAAAMSHVRVLGIDCHIGSQITEVAPFIEALGHLTALVDRLALKGIELEHIDIGGGLGVRYRDECPPSIEDYLQPILEQFKSRSETLILEPGRSITADAGVLITRVQYLKNNGEKHFAMIDAAMNDILRPALYEAWMDIKPVEANTTATAIEYDIVGPVCESTDVLGRNRSLAIGAGDLLCICDAGAYGFSMSSNYNSRPRPAEVMVDGREVHLIRARESLADLTRGEHLLPERKAP